MLLSLGDRGIRVAELQRMLNAHPTTLPSLIADAVFGPKTKARVVEFQRASGLTADGLAGDRTLARLQGSGDAAQPIDLVALINELARLVPAVQRAGFLVSANALVPRSAVVGGAGVVGGGTDNNAGAIPIVIIALFIILMLMAALVAQSRNPSTQRMGQEWARRFERLKVQIRGKPIEVQTAETLKEIRQRGKDVIENAKIERQKCLDKLSPKELEDCKTLLKKLSETLQSLAQAVAQGLGNRGATEEGLKARIARAIEAVFEASAAAAVCTKCDNMVL